MKKKVENIPYVVSETREVACTIDAIRKTIEGDLINETTIKREGEDDFIFKSIMVDFVPKGDDTDSLDNLTGNKIFKAINNGKHPLLLVKFEEILEEVGEDGFEAALEGKSITLLHKQVQLDVPYYMIRSSIKDGKKVYKKVINKKTQKPVSIDFFNIYRFVNEKGSFEADISKKIRSILVDDKKNGGGFMVVESSPATDADSFDDAPI